MRYFSNNYTFVTADRVEDSIYGNGALPDKALLITFDDAYPSVYTAALPVLIKYNVPAIVFTITSLVGTTQPYWWDEVMYYLPSTMDEPQRKAKLWEIKDWSTAERVSFVNDLRANSQKPTLKRTQLTWEQLREMEKNNVVIANHSHTHPLLHVTSKDQIEKELIAASNLLLQYGLSGSRIFAYPNGNSSPVAEELMRTHSFTMSFLFDHRIQKEIDHPYRISRLSLDTRSPLIKTKLIMRGWHSQYLNLRNKLVR